MRLCESSDRVSTDRNVLPSSLFCVLLREMKAVNIYKLSRDQFGTRDSFVARQRDIELKSI